MAQPHITRQNKAQTTMDEHRLAILGWASLRCSTRIGFSPALGTKMFIAQKCKLDQKCLKTLEPEWMALSEIHHASFQLFAPSIFIFALLSFQ